MLDFLKNLFSKDVTSNTESINREHLLKIASCALLIEVAKSDDEFSTSERNRIIELMREQFNISTNSVRNLIKQSEEQIKESVSIYEFTEIVNAQLDNKEKYKIIKNLWRLAFVDGKLDKYEDYYIRKIANNLNLSNQDRIAAKLEVKDELKK